MDFITEIGNSGYVDERERIYSVRGNCKTQNTCPEKTEKRFSPSNSIYEIFIGKLRQKEVNIQFIFFFRAG